MSLRSSFAIRRQAGTVAWRIGQVLSGLFLLGAVLVATQTKMNAAEQACTAALLLAGIAALATGRAAKYAAFRGRRRRIRSY
jgi:hypothetical protein